MSDSKLAPSGADPTPLTVIVPYAAAAPEGARTALSALQLPHLDRLLPTLQATLTDVGDEYHYIPPHERALARAMGLPDGVNPAVAPPWAAHRAQQQGAAPGKAWAWFHPCHWLVGADQIQMSAPSELALSDSEAQALLAVLAPFFAEDGIELQIDTAERWLASGEVFRGLHSAALDRVLRRDIQLWLPEGPGARTLRRLQSETQMLLYTHRLNEARQAARRPVLNSFWISGSGVLAPTWQAPTQSPTVWDALRQPALDGDWAAWSAAWQQLDAGPVRELLERSERGHPIHLTLCGERSAHSWQSAPRSLGQKLKGWFQRPRCNASLEAL